MLKKMLAILLSTAMVLGLGVQVYAAQEDAEVTQNTETQRPMDEILNRYHAKSFELSSPNGNASRSVQTSETIKQDTINELRDAGYEAYDVNPDTYATLEEQLNTDFSEMGLTHDSSYIIIIGGESTSGNCARLAPDVEGVTPDFGDSSFTYTYNGVTYAMRSVTVTAAEDNRLRETSSIELVTELNWVSVKDILNVPITILTSINDYFRLGTLWSLLGLLPDVEPTQRDSIDYRGSSNWTITYTQVYDTVNQKWYNRSSVDYVTMHFSVLYTNYDAVNNCYDSYYEDGIYCNTYSDYYYDTAWQREMAAVAHLNYTMYSSPVNKVVYQVDDIVVLTHHRTAYVD